MQASFSSAKNSSSVSMNVPPSIFSFIVEDYKTGIGEAVVCGSNSNQPLTTGYNKRKANDSRAALQCEFFFLKKIENTAQ